jgi:predicted nucleic acid-binding protein
MAARHQCRLRAGRARGDAKVVAIAEFEKGIAALPPDAPARPRLEAAVVALERRLRGRILSVADAVVRRWGRISVAAKLFRGEAPPVIDTLLAATAVEHDLPRHPQRQGRPRHRRPPLQPVGR